MQSFKQGHLHVTSWLLPDHQELGRIADSLAAHSYSGRVPSRGWGGFTLNDEPPLGDPGVPSVHHMFEHEFLLGRYLLDRENVALRRASPMEFEDMPRERRYVADSVDILVLSMPEGLGVQIATHDVHDLPLIESALSQALGYEGFDPIPLECTKVESDIYLWLLYRLDRHHGHLSAELELTEFRTLSTIDIAGRLSRSLRGVDLERIDTLGAIAEEQILGPAKLALYDKTVGLVADLFLIDGGKFDIHRGRSGYDEDLDEGGIVELLGARMTIDIVASVLPRLHSAYRADMPWRQGDRLSFIDDCRQRIIQRQLTR